MSKLAFSQEHDIAIASIDEIVLSLNIIQANKEDEVSDDYIISKGYHQIVLDFVDTRLENSLQTSE